MEVPSLRSELHFVGNASDYKVRLKSTPDGSNVHSVYTYSNFEHSLGCTLMTIFLGQNPVWWTYISNNKLNCGYSFRRVNPYTTHIPNKGLTKAAQ